MTRQVYQAVHDALSILGRDGYSTHSVVGKPGDFYVYLCGRPPAYSAWIKGNPTLHSQFKRLHSARLKEQFCRLVEKTMGQNPKGRHGTN